MILVGLPNSMGQVLEFSFISEKTTVQRDTPHLKGYKIMESRLELRSPSLPSSSHPFLPSHVLMGTSSVKPRVGFPAGLRVGSEARR